MTMKTAIFFQAYCMVQMILFIAGLVVGLMVTGADGASTITITPSTQYQTIDGLGAYMDSRYMVPPVFYHDSLGATMVRLTLNSFDFQPSNNMTDSTNSDLSKFNVSAINDAISVINGLKGYGDVKFIESSWSPPAWMKDMSRSPLTGATCVMGDPALCGGHLASKYYVSYAGLTSAFCQIIKQRTGVDIFAISLQNEPFFIEPYRSCVFTPQEYVNCLKAIGARLKKDGVPAKCFGAEDMLYNIMDATRNYATVIYNDATASPYLYAVAVHGYTDGVHPVPSSAGVLPWTRAGNVALSYKKKFWMTETSGLSQTSWSSAMGLASNLFMSMKYGQLSAWTYYCATECGGGLLCNSAHTTISLASKNYYKFIRPGAVSVGCVNSGDELFPVAFLHAQNKTLAIVIVNQATTAPQLTLSSGTPLPSTFEKYTSSATKKCADDGSVSSSSPITIDANSVTTLYGQNYTATDIDTRHIDRPFSGRADANGYQVYRVNGSLVRAGSRNNGVYIKKFSGNERARITPIALIDR
jgi:O-glycosyl hydrolase